jgi:osmotically inducible protein OsmC
MVDSVPTITSINLVTVGQVPGLDEAKFQELAEGAKAGCPVSRALAGVPEITLSASLAS